MTVTIDPSEVRRQATVKGPSPMRSLRLPVRTLVVGGIGGAGLLAFTIGAFSFFGGLADPRVRHTRPAPIASKMPDLKDGLPALVTENGESAPAAPVLNLPKPIASETAPTPSKVDVALRTDTTAPSEPTVAPTRLVAAEATGSVAQKKIAPARTKPTPTIENASTVSGDAKPVPLITPARTAGVLSPKKGETVRAKPVAIAALPSEPEPVSTPAAASKPTAAQDSATDTKPTATKKPAQKVARAKEKPVAEASAEPEAAPASDSAEEDGFTSKVNRGIKTIEGLFGKE